MDLGQAEIDSREKQVWQTADKKKNKADHTNSIHGYANTANQMWKLRWWNNGESDSQSGQIKSYQTQANHILPSISTLDFSVLSSSLFAGTGCSASAGNKSEKCCDVGYTSHSRHISVFEIKGLHVSRVCSLSCLPSDRLYTLMWAWWTRCSLWGWSRYRFILLLCLYLASIARSHVWLCLFSAKVEKLKNYPEKHKTNH